MDNTTQLTPIPNFSAYALSPLGDVYRTVPPKRGHMANMKGPHRVQPVCHPRGTRWYVQLTSDAGKRHRINVADLSKLIAEGGAQ